MAKLVFHVDVNSAYLSWEAARRVANGERDIRLIPSVIGGDREKRTGVVLAKSIPAKKFGIKTGEPIGMALRKCPDLYMAKPDFRLYEENSKKFMDICREYAPVVEKASIDECYLDLSGTHRIYPDPVALAHTIKDRIRNEFGFTVNVGIGDNKLLAKMASDFEKPDKVHTLFLSEIPQKMWPLPVGELFTVGGATADKLRQAKIMTIGDLAHTDLSRVQKIVGMKMGKHIHDYANGIDSSPVLAVPEEAKGYSISTTLEDDIKKADQAYPTMLNAIDDTKTKNGQRLFTPAHFDLIIIDESHRSIFKKYRAIFEYFDAIMVGLTATPKTDVDRNTYDFFEMEHGIPTYAYDYETAVYQDHVLVPYYNYEVKTKFLEEGITYDDLSDEDKERFEDDFIEDGLMPEFIPSAQLNKFVFNETTVDIVLQDLMERGIRVAGGDRLGKTIIFAQNKRHAEFILERFNKLYPKYNGTFTQRVICDDTYAPTIIDDFKVPDKDPIIAVSVDMMDTGIDVPQCVNLVFFKKVRSKAKFWQMIGRGTRLCKGLTCTDQIDGEYTDKKRFLIFDYCGNFEYFRTHKEGFESRDTKSLTENIFGKKVRLAVMLQESAYAGDEFQAWRSGLVGDCFAKVQALNTDLIAVRLRMQSVEKYKKPGAFNYISEGDKGELLQQIAPIVQMDDNDEYAKPELKRQWEIENGRPWPKYETDVYSASGKLIRKAGSDYDAHHIQPLSLGGKNEASNITPLHAEVHYDKQGVHAPNSPYSQLDKALGGI